jgi:hypothetical protein
MIVSYDGSLDSFSNKDAAVLVMVMRKGAIKSLLPFYHEKRRRMKLYDDRVKIVY